ncbi:MAG: hypothetical protein K6E11_03055 [Bacilli bacterium]|nr:hypothetical protein [Bacilli bacterium]
MKTKFKNILLIFTSALLVSGCNVSEDSSNEKKSDITSSTTNTTSTPSGSTSSGKTKVTFPAHTISDSNPPIDSNTPGQQVSESTWNSFKNGSASKFSGYYNFSYTAFISMNSYQQQFFTKNGYAYNSLQGSTYTSMYYERVGTTLYEYADVSDGWLRQPSSLNLTNTFTSRILDELKVHMFAFSNYSWDSLNESYFYDGGSFTSRIKFQGGYLSNLVYTISGGITYYINYMFETSIEFPASYIYQ